MTKLDFNGARRKRTNVFACEFCSEHFERKWGAGRGEFLYCSKSCKAKADAADPVKKAAHNATIRKTAIANVDKYRQKAIEAEKKIHQFNLATLSKNRHDPLIRKRQRENTLIALRRPEVRAKMSAKQKEVQNLTSVKQKRHETMKRTGKYGRSTVETRFGDWLSSHFPLLEKQVPINGWMIDFFLPEIDTFVQFDGVYWHGLCAYNPATKQGQYIAKVIERDQEQSKWFPLSGKRLVRITDVQFKTMDMNTWLREHLMKRT